MTNSCDPFFRRDFLKTLGVAAIPVLTHGCDAEQPPPPTFRAKPPHAASKGKGKGKTKTNISEAEVEVGRALLEQTLIDDRQRLSLPGKLSGLCGIGRQLRVTRPGFGAALYTLEECRDDDDPDLVRMNLLARQRLGTPDTFAGIVSNQVTASGLSDAQAQSQGEFVERLVDNGHYSGLVVLAPHGGAIEPQTDKQAEHLAALLGASSWICKGWRTGGGAFDAWHIRSTDLHPDSFPGLEAIAKRGFAYAVSFHGMDSIAGGVIVGGGAPLELKKLVVNAIKAAVGTSISVGVAAPTDIYDGDSKSNIVNWLTADGYGGIQVEQDRVSRVDHGLAIAEAIAGVFGSLV
ncbi:MAG TPA: poly-gamma-glutamate hydrolase family protein [Enhygromyxa sp.]|nr:poly-gamma-glutamate hydrolase family protein [Enhygromyxa sp.]